MIRVLRQNVSRAQNLVGLMVMGALGMGCSGAEPTFTAEADVRMTYFYTDESGDPAYATNPHSIRQATSEDGVNFSGEKEIYSSNDLVDPDFFKISSGLYGLLVTDHTVNQLVYATSSTADGTFTTVTTGGTRSGGQSSTLQMGSQFRSFTTGISVNDFDPTTGAFTTSTATGLALNATQLNLAKGVLGDPSVIQLADGKYMMFMKYAPSGAKPRDHELWKITSNADGTQWDFTSAAKIGMGSVPGALRAGDEILVYYVTFDKDVNENKSLAVSRSLDGGVTFETSAVFLDGEVISGAYDPTVISLSE